MSFLFLKDELPKFWRAEENKTVSVYIDRMRAMFKEEEFWSCWILWSGWMANFLLREMWQFFEKKGLELIRTVKASGSMTASRKQAFIRRESTHHSMRWTTVDSLPRRTVTCTIEGPKRSLDGGTMSSTKTGRRGTSSWTWRQFWGITNLASSKGTRWWCFGGIEDRERNTIFLEKMKVDYNFRLNWSIHISDPPWIHFFCNAIVATDSPLKDLRKWFLIRVYFSQRLSFYAFNGFCVFHSSLK